MRISIIIPVRNGGGILKRCLRAIADSRLQPFEMIVADDGSTDDTAHVAADFGARVITTPKPGSGPAVGRNLAAQHATGDLLFFCDSDVEIKVDTLSRIAQIFENDSTLTALFGSYDDAPSDPNFISQYKNLFHHYVHQQGAEEASTFWSGCGVIRRDVFLECGGFSSRYTLPSIEDIELGYALKSRGHRIRLEKSLQVKTSQAVDSLQPSAFRHPRARHSLDAATLALARIHQRSKFANTQSPQCRRHLFDAFMFCLEHTATTRPSLASPSPRCRCC